MDAKFILVCYDTKTSMKQQELAEKSLKGTQNGQYQEPSNRESSFMWPENNKDQ